MKIDEMPTAKLAGMPAPYNPRFMNAEELDHLAASMRTFSVVQPIVVNKRSPEQGWPPGSRATIVGGHQRVTAAGMVGIETLPVVWVDLNEAQEIQLNLALNRIHGDFDEQRLGLVLADLRRLEADTAITGFSDLEVTRALAQLERTEEGLTDPDLIPEPPDVPVTTPGQLIELGRHRLLCGDAGSPEDLDRLLGELRVQLLNTDPPYNVKVEPRSNNAIAMGGNTKGNVPNSQRDRMHHQAMDLKKRPGAKIPTGKMRAKDRVLDNDFISDEAFANKLRAWFKNAARKMDPGTGFYIWGGYSNLKNYPAALEESLLYFSQCVIWVKEWPVLTRKDFMGNHEWCQPEGTCVLTTDGEVPIESLRNGDRVVSFSRRSSAMVGLRHGAQVQVTSRDHEGELYRVEAAGTATWTTDGHPWTVKLVPEADRMHCVYLMRRGGWWRVGRSRLLSTWGFGLKQRMFTEGGEQGWILSVHPSGTEAAIEEQLVSVRYGIPTTYWRTMARQTGRPERREMSMIERLYDHLDLDELHRGAERAIQDHGRRLEHPFVDHCATREKYGRRVPMIVRACNLLSGAMMVPVPGRGQQFAWDRITVQHREVHRGKVWSMDVADHHHYIADGIVTHNCFYGWREGAAHLWYGPKNATDVWTVKKINPTSMVHLTEKPVELAERAMGYSSAPGDVVLDLFGGSGSTLIGAEKMGRRAMLMELDPAYCDVIVQRWEAFTGKRAQRT